ncbi:hypothetical protein ACFWEJ_06650 [Promicromonospora sp. NPDC060204]|uniref:hypothetical protein n=1 Tax=Promicromonospora sp. NPDC060204 TaxID=3347071 RepID=UPI00366616B6
MPQAKLDRRELVRRHNPVLTAAHPTAVLTVGNGNVALTVDISGLQTFPEFHELRPDPSRTAHDGLDGLPDHAPRPFDLDDYQIPLRTQSTWGWYETRPTRSFRFDEAVTDYPTPRGPVPYADRMGLQRAADPIPEELAPGAWFHYNPRRAHLGRLTLVRTDGTVPEDPHVLGDPRTELDLWSGRVEARYVLAGEPVTVTTVADPGANRFAVRVESPLLSAGWGVAWVFDPQQDDLAWFEHLLDEETVWTATAPRRWTARRSVETTTYGVQVATTGVLSPHGRDGVRAGTRQPSIEVVVEMSPGPVPEDAPPSFAEVCAASACWWQEYWESGAAVSLEGSTDERAHELERRIVLSQHLLAVNCAGSAPPAETGLTYNTWSGKFHLEMHWWHGAHFPLWGRGHLLERSLAWYHRALASARTTARRQGYRGARWPKQTDLSARESPSNIGVFLVWQQPHPIHLLELLRQEGRDDSFLRAHYPLVEATADFMADFVEDRDGTYTLPPPLIPAQESYLADRRTVSDPTFELAYWAWALRVANQWRSRLGLPRRVDWDRVAWNMRPPTRLPGGGYAAIATPPFLVRKDHPSMLMALGWVPATGLVDPDVMAATLDDVWEQWDLQSTWGWDYPVLAMTAVALGDLGRAIDGLLLPSPKNTYLANGHNPQMPGFLTLYLPANGGLLAAVAHIATAAEAGAPLPDGWNITAEGLRTLPPVPQGNAAVP